MNFIEELEWRGMMNNITPGLAEHLEQGSRIGYIGFDPTAPSLTIGNFVPIMLLKLFQLSGHTPIALMGGATGRIGDPSGKDKERELKSFEELDVNLDRQINQVKKFLDFEEGKNKALIVNNLDFYKNMNVLDFLRDVGKTLTVNYMIAKESVQKRLETGISFTEFSYQLLQGYDYQVLFQDYNCTVQMGGSDQWGNILSGNEFIRKNLGETAYGVTTPLLTKSDGSKFGKSTEGNIWLDAEMTNPYRFYQFWINADDADIPKYTRYFTLKSKEEVESLEREFENDPNELKRLLARELTIRVHSEEDYQNVVKVSELLFSRQATSENLKALDENALSLIASEIPSFQIHKEILTNRPQVIDLLSEHTHCLLSKSEARRAIQGNAISINKEKVTELEATVTPDQLLHGKYLMVENGKKNKFMIVAE